MAIFFLASSIASGVLQEHRSTLNVLGGNGFFYGDVAAITLFLIAINLDIAWPKFLIQSGVISYSIYLLHWPATTTTALIPLVDNHPLMHAAATLVLTLFASHWVFKKIEAPMMDFSKAIVKSQNPEK